MMPEQEQLQRLQEENSALRDQTVHRQEQMEHQLQTASRAATDEQQELQVRATQRGWRDSRRSMWDSIMNDRSCC